MVDFKGKKRTKESSVVLPLILRQIQWQTTLVTEIEVDGTISRPGEQIPPKSVCTVELRFGGLMKNEFAVAYGRFQHSKAAKIAKELRENIKEDSKTAISLGTPANIGRLDRSLNVGTIQMWQRESNDRGATIMFNLSRQDMACY